MEIRSGDSRIVVLVGNKAIKIAKIRLLDPFRRLIGLVFSRSTRKELLTKYGHAPTRCATGRIFIGLIANRNEYRYYQSTKDPRVMPVERQLLWGLAIVHERGIPIGPDEIVEDCPFHVTLEDAHDLTGMHQFCRRSGTRQVVVVDFGNKETEEFLLATMP
jgi:hypothetical protein